MGRGYIFEIADAKCSCDLKSTLNPIIGNCMNIIAMFIFNPPHFLQHETND